MRPYNQSDATYGCHMTTQRIKRRIDGDIEAEIRRLAVREWAATQIHRELERRSDFKGRVPSLRTVQRIADDYAKDTTWWSLADADPDDAALILPVLAELMEQSQGHVSRLYKGLADWIVRIRRAAPDMPVTWSLEVTLTCWEYARRDESLAGVVEMLAFAPWRGKRQRNHYIKRMVKWHSEWFSVLEPDDAFPWGEFMGQLTKDAMRDPNAAGVITMFEATERQDTREKEESDD